MKGFKGLIGFARPIVVAALGLALSIPAGAASAATVNVQLPSYIQVTTPVVSVQVKPAAVPSSTFAAEVVKLVNKERTKRGLKTLKINTKAASVAMIKAKDLKNNHYFSHTSPTYGSPFAMMKKFGITYHYAGENIAMGQRTPAEVMRDWMNSKGHRANILSKNFKSIGVAYYKGEWVQHFLG